LLLEVRVKAIGCDSGAVAFQLVLVYIDEDGGNILEKFVDPSKVKE
jgi:hypothetical protein